MPQTSCAARTPIASGCPQVCQHRHFVPLEVPNFVHHLSKPPPSWSASHRAANLSARSLHGCFMPAM
ncbi:hypothetical protein M758_3G201200 [Ceratodon purpureus]|uniref:Uncharacterized protein n=1 Tax=Ceratodon purpureus TaxID=3225 RepID=A0A8T0IKK3_CERPU|nr:hypothetical protein KC19_3G201900 [Ceratodon purpureus]KAG0623776.1 hypothetical protein M758_3G201200 [Ceratodon purpureus]